MVFHLIYIGCSITRQLSSSNARTGTLIASLKVHFRTQFTTRHVTECDSVSESSFIEPDIPAQTSTLYPRPDYPLKWTTDHEGTLRMWNVVDDSAENGSFRAKMAHKRSHRQS